MIEIKKSGKSDIEDLMKVRLEMLRVVNNLAPDDEFSKTLVDCSHDYFLKIRKECAWVAKDEEIISLDLRVMNRYKRKHFTQTCNLFELV